jgi:hypothetical protein
MVVMEGVRIKNSPVTVSIPDTPATKALKNELTTEQSLRADVFKIAADIEEVQRETAVRTIERDALATLVAATEQGIQQRRRQLDGAKQIEFDLARSLSESKQQLQQLAQQREQAEQETGAPIVVECYPTPISRAVDGPEAHIVISNGRVAFIPLEALLDQLKTNARRQAQQLVNQPELTETVGPVEGFRLKYTLERVDLAPDAAHGRPGGGYARVQRWTLVPTSDSLGEPVRLALSEGSDFYKTLAKILPGRTTITIWVYPDGFDGFRQVRKELYRRSYTIAARPLPPGLLISGSPDGSKSAAQ